MVNLELYRVFYTVAKCGSLTKAAQELYISQPAVSQAIKQLESQLGVSLFNRTHKGMDLSASGGKLIFKQVEEALGLLEQAENALLELKTTASGTIRIGATDSIFAHLLADKIAEYNARYPAVKIELLSSTSLYILDRLHEGQCDVAFLNLPLEDDEVRLCGTVTNLSDIFVAGRKYENLKGKPIELKELQDLPLLLIEKNTVFRRELDKYASSFGLHMSPDIEVANWDFMKKLVIKGMGVGCIPREYCKKDLENGDLIELNVTPPPPTRGVGIAVAKNVPLSFAMQEFLNMFKHE